MYTDWLLNKSIDANFKAFKMGFDLVIRDTCLVELLRPEEVEMLVSGSEISVIPFFAYYLYYSQCWASCFLKVTSYILLATELFSYSHILPIK